MAPLPQKLLYIKRDNIKKIKISSFVVVLKKEEYEMTVVEFDGIEGEELVSLVPHCLARPVQSGSRTLDLFPPRQNKSKFFHTSLDPIRGNAIGFRNKCNALSVYSQF